MSDTHDEWLDLNGRDKGEKQEKARRDKREAHDKNKQARSYRVYRRAGLRPWCAVRFLIQHRLLEMTE